MKKMYKKDIQSTSENDSNQNSHELQPLLNNPNNVNGSEPIEINEIFPVRLSGKDDGIHYRTNAPVTDGKQGVSLSSQETDSEEDDDVVEEEYEEPSETFMFPQETERLVNDTVYVEPAPKWLGRSASLHKKHDTLSKYIHYNRKNKMDDILDLESEFNQVKLLTMKDNDGLTCLMKAITRNSLECINSLLSRFEFLMPVFAANNVNKLDALRSTDGKNLFHVAAEILNGREMIDAIEMCYLKEDIVDMPDRNGATPLITACKNGNRQMAVRLVSYGAKIDQLDKDGYSPIYLAALAGSAEILKFFLVHGHTKSTEINFRMDGTPPWPLLSNRALYKNRGTILGAVAEGGIVNTIETCFSSARSKQLVQRCIAVELQNNPHFLHRLCATSLTDLVEIVIAYDEQLISGVDGDGMTPLMRATEAGQLENVKEILKSQLGKTTVKTARKEDHKTAVMIACANGFDDIAKYIVTNVNVQLDTVDNENKNVFHYASKHHGVLKVLIEVCSKTDEWYKHYERCLQVTDKYGDISLHYAAISSHKNVKLLLNHGVPYDMTSSRMERNSLHYAACANLETVKTLVEFVKKKYDEDDVKKFINSVDCKRQSSLHLAASLGHWKTVSYLLDNGAEITCDNEKETPLHQAAAFGCLKTVKCLIRKDKQIIHFENRVGETAAMFAAVSGKTQVVEVLLQNKATLWARSHTFEKKRTCLDWAVANKHSITASVILDHQQWREVMQRSFHGADGLLAEMVKTMPSVAIKVLDKCSTKSKSNEEVFDFFCLQTIEEFVCRGESRRRVAAMKALENMADLASDDCLRHKLVQKFLNEKWKRRARNWYMFPLLLYTVFLIALTTYIGLVRNDTSVEETSMPLPTNSTIGLVGNTQISPQAPGAIAATVICVAFAGLSIIKEIVQLFHQRQEYFCHLSTYMELAMYICVFIFLFPLSNKKNDYQWQAGAVAIFLAWLNFIGFIKNFPAYGIYIIMAKKIFLTFLKVFVPLGFFIMAFALTFFILLREDNIKQRNVKHDDSNDGFTNIARALVTSFAMMVGEINYRETFLENTRSPHFVLSLIFLVIFMILITVLLMNLLTGLAVGDIGEILRRAMTEKRVQQAMLIVDMDKSLNRYPLLRASYVEPLHETPGHKTTKTWKTLSEKLYPDMHMTKNDEKSSFEREYYALKDQLDDITTKVEEIQDVLKNNNGNVLFNRKVWKRGQGYSI